MDRFIFYHWLWFAIEQNSNWIPYILEIICVKQEMDNDIIFKHFGSFALPKQIIKIKEMPKTKSGKILRRLLKILYLNPCKKINFDLSTISNKKILNQLKKQIKFQKQNG